MATHTMQCNVIIPGFGRQLGCPKIVLDRVGMYIMFVRTTMLRRTSNRNTSSSWSMQTHEYCNRNKLYKVPDAACNPNIN